MIMLSEPIGNIATDYIKKIEKENEEYQKGMIADAKIIKEADNKIIKLEKENDDLKAKLKEEIMTISECVRAWKKKIAELEAKLAARNGRIIELEECYNNMEDQRDELRERTRSVKFLDREEVEKIIYILHDGLKRWLLNEAGTSEQESAYIEYNIYQAITAICKLAIPEVKTLDRAEVENAFREVYQDCTVSDIETQDLITTLCKLAIQPISKDKIYDLLFQSFSTWSMPQTGTSDEWEQFLDIAIIEMKLKCVEIVDKIRAIEYEKDLFKRIKEHLDKADK